MLLFQTCPQLLSLSSFNAPDSALQRRATRPAMTIERCYGQRSSSVMPKGALPMCRASATETAVDTTAEPETGSRTLQGAEADRWKQAVQSVQALGFEELDADNILRKAFGWSGQGYWRRSKEYDVPAPGQVDAVAEFLRGLGLGEKEVTKAVKVFPQILGLPVEEQLQGNVDKLRKTWKMTDKVIPGVIKRQPQVLGYNVDCEGNCMGECNRCWVRF